MVESVKQGAAEVTAGPESMMMPAKPKDGGCGAKRKRKSMFSLQALLCKDVEALGK